MKRRFPVLGAALSGQALSFLGYRHPRYSTTSGEKRNHSQRVRRRATRSELNNRSTSATVWPQPVCTPLACTRLTAYCIASFFARHISSRDVLDCKQSVTAYMATTIMIVHINQMSSLKGCKKPRSLCIYTVQYCAHLTQIVDASFPSSQSRFR
jgi:hypothetical protein